MTDTTAAKSKTPHIMTWKRKKKDSNAGVYAH